VDIFVMVICVCEIISCNPYLLCIQSISKVAGFAKKERLTSKTSEVCKKICKRGDDSPNCFFFQNLYWWKPLSSKNQNIFHMLSMNKIVSFLLIFLFISSTLITMLSTVSSLDLIEDSWNTKKSMSQARAGLGVVAVDGKIYAIGGESDRTFYTATNINERYDPTVNTWVTLKPMPTARRDFAIAACQGKIYCIGGGILGSGPLLYTGLSVNEVYDMATDSWCTKASFPILQMNMQAHAVDGKIYVITSRGDLYMYDLITDKWTNNTSMPSPMDGVLGSTVVDGKIIVVHSVGTSVGIDPGVKIYCPKTDKWTEGSPPTYNGSFYWIERVGATTGVYAPQKLYVLGADESANHAYDLVSDTWSNAKAMPTKRSQFGVVAVDDVLYVIGGYIQLGPAPGAPVYGTTAVNEQYVPIGYSSTPIGPKPSDSLITSEPEPSTSLQTYLLVVILAITTITIAMGMFFYFRKRKRGVTGDVSIFNLSKPLM
jgi:N-acetylneuraminic acid mutarotase